MARKERADRLLVEQGLAGDTDLAARMIMAGEVEIRHSQADWTRVDKPGDMLPSLASLRRKAQRQFVSRGGLKLLSALQAFELDVSGSVALDIGASTGGFTDCLLQYGVKRVYAVDVGYGQLDWRLRQDQRVINLERVNFRLAPPSLLPERVDLAVADCSFISLRSIFPPLINFLVPGGQVLALVKPQFESNLARRGKGVIRDEVQRQEIVSRLGVELCQRHGLLQLGLVPVAVTGPKGNQEFMLWLRQPAPDQAQ